MRRNSTYAASPKQWGFFARLTGDTLPSGCSKSKASKLIEQALAGTYQSPARHIGVGRGKIVDYGRETQTTWDVRVDYRWVSSHPTREAALAVAQATARPHETVEVNDTSIHELLVD